MSVIHRALLLLALIPTAATAEEVAVLLPQTGPAAKAGMAVRDGLLAAYYQSGGAENASLALNFRDSGAMVQVSPALDMLLTPSTRLLIGPLLREHVVEVLASPPSVPVLALNRINGQDVPGIWQFALSPEEEMPPLIAQLQRDGISRVRILLQADESGERIRLAFENAWKAAGGQLLPAFTIKSSEDGGISASLRELLADSGTARTQAFFLASPGLAVQVIPLLGFYQKTPVPVYSTSLAFDEIAPLLLRRDLNGLRFCGTPWTLENRWPEQSVINAVTPPESGSYNRLYAFGADAWTLQSLLPVRKAVSTALRTGLINLDSAGLHRIPACMEIQDGNPRPIAPDRRSSR
ncbi:MAG TPA: penicillin-binding protein activator [Fluviicoccus sp.]|nr:penicillin-binding protein activator [Fluviicoccus sp.]